MAQCPNGSQPAAGAPTSFWAYDFGWVNYLTAKMPGLGVLLSPFVQPELVLVSDFCAGEPVVPAAPTFQDYVGAFLTNPDAQRKVLAYWKANYLSSIWSTYCV